LLKLVKMSLETCRVLFIVSCLAIILLSTLGLLGPFLPLPRSAERFSELWILGPGHKAEDYPFNIRASEPQQVYVGVRNHLGASAYYALRVRLRTQGEPLPNQTTTEPSPPPSLYEFRAFVAQNDEWETPVSFEVTDVEFSAGVCVVKGLRLNGGTLPVRSVSSWDPDRRGFYHELCFELWLYNSTSGSFEYHNRFVGIWLNMTH